ncbi:hypothetical protein [Xylanibacter brevis]|jgi:hypothetical protein|uniref:hypothetical protein n=1 Tax=Xylanibacter brevis TaxID=83231 RepID=UPI000A59625E|nr:hypothetical protein [Xylanibacter brevis]
MKKIYMMPSMKVITIRNTQILAGSPLNTSGENPQQDDFSGSTEDTSGNLSRRHDVWADEEEEDI